jgi:hypothetical protein
MFIKVPAGLNKTARGSSFSLELFINVEWVCAVCENLPLFFFAQSIVSTWTGQVETSQVRMKLWGP